MLQEQQSDPTHQLVFNGLDGSTGAYLFAGVEAELARRARAEELDSAHLRDLKARAQASQATFGVVGTVEDPNDLAQTGWGVVFPERADPAIREALSELLDWRKKEAASTDGRRYQEYVGPRGWHVSETKEEFLRNRGAAPSGPVEPDRMPYYLLLVGSPEDIPYSLQYQLDVQYAVGRICFATLDEYVAYARSVVTAETANPREARLAFFGVANPDDAATRLSAGLLVAPLATAAAEWQRRPSNGRTPWQIQTVQPADATKARLAQLLGGSETPALLFTASHGLGFPFGDTRQEGLQGALVCQDWPGPHDWPRGAPISRDHYFAAEDVADDARLLGMIAFHFACYGMGTPRLDDYPQLMDGRIVAQRGGLGTRLAGPIAPRPFVARLPQRLLGHAKGGALAAIGHVERALGSSFLWQTEGRVQRSSLGMFEGGLSRLLRGYRVGAAIESFNERYAEECTALSDEIREIEQFGKIGDPVELARMWTASADARGYTVFGDPAVRLSINPNQLGSGTIEPVATIRAGSVARELPATAPAEQDTDVAAAVSNGGERTVRVDIDPATGRIRVITQFSADPPSSGGTDAVEFGVVDDMRAALGSSLKALTERVVDAFANLTADVTSLEVVTYLSDRPETVKYDARQHMFNESARQVAMTCVRADGDVVALVPRTDSGAIDRELWSVHCELVERTRAQRAEMIKAIGSAASGLLSLGRGGL